ncbi:MAG: hypothetical protein R2818_09435 [Flavobacteriales bacterium]
MNRRTIIAMSLVLCSAAELSAQVSVDGPILLTGTTNEDRQVTGLPSSTGPDHVLTAGVVQGGAAEYAAAVNGTSWNIDLPAFGTSPSAGTHLIVRAPAPSAGPIQLQLNGSGPYPVLRGLQPMNGTELTEGRLLSLVFDGSAFQVLNGKADQRRDCPTNMVDVNGQFCMELTERGSTDFFTAALNCSAQDRRMCSWSEFHVACLRATELALTGMTNNWEWTNNTANEDNSVRVVGSGSCISAGNGISVGSVPRTYRCCYTR